MLIPIRKFWFLISDENFRNCTKGPPFAWTPFHVLIPIRKFPNTISSSNTTVWHQTQAANQFPVLNYMTNYWIIIHFRSPVIILSSRKNADLFPPPPSPLERFMMTGWIGKIWRNSSGFWIPKRFFIFSSSVIHSVSQLSFPIVPFILIFPAKKNYCSSLAASVVVSICE